MILGIFLLACIKQDELMPIEAGIPGAQDFTLRLVNADEVLLDHNWINGGPEIKFALVAYTKENKDFSEEQLWEQREEEAIASDGSASFESGATAAGTYHYLITVGGIIENLGMLTIDAADTEPIIEDVIIDPAALPFIGKWKFKSAVNPFDGSEIEPYVPIKKFEVKDISSYEDARRVYISLEDGTVSDEKFEVILTDYSAQQIDPDTYLYAYFEHEYQGNRFNYMSSIMYQLPNYRMNYQEGNEILLDAHDGNIIRLIISREDGASPQLMTFERDEQ